MHIHTMKPPIRTTLTLTEPQLNWLRDEAARLGLSVGELIRRLLDQARGT